MSFYMYDYNDIPTPAPFGMWYAEWSTTEPCVQWSQTKPSKVPDGETSWVVGVGDEEFCPSGATPLSGGGKTLPPQPPVRADSMSGFTSAFDVWANSVKDFGKL
jgi:hypothetical protein